MNDRRLSAVTDILTIFVELKEDDRDEVFASVAKALGYDVETQATGASSPGIPNTVDWPSIEQKIAAVLTKAGKPIPPRVIDAGLKGSRISQDHVRKALARGVKAGKFARHGSPNAPTYSVTSNP